MLQRSPECPGDSAVYRCSVSSGRLEWIWAVATNDVVPFTLLSSINGPGIRTETIKGVTVTFNTTDVGPSYINVIATVPDPERLNGVTLDCNGQTLTISITHRSEFI